MSKILIGITLIVLLAVVGFAALSQSGSSTAPTPAAVSDSTNTATTPAATTTTTTTNTNTTDSSNTAATGGATTNTTANTNTNTTTETSGYTMAKVATHKDATSCWSAVNGNVYDLTKWIDQHPGGAQRILSICGKDGSAAFNDEHGGQRRPANELAGFLLGPLAK